MGEYSYMCMGACIVCIHIWYMGVVLIGKGLTMIMPSRAEKNNVEARYYIYHFRPRSIKPISVSIYM